ncbi:MAG: DUF4783 domain-containing protein [Bacteroidota bacterium]
MRTTPPTVVVFFLAVGLFGPCLGAGSGVALAQTDSTALLQIERGFRFADPEVLLDGATERVDIIIFGQGASYSRAQAAFVLSDFFRRYPPRQVVFEQEVLAEDRRSIIGRYWVTGGGDEPIGVSIRLRARDGGWQLQGIRVNQGGR